VRRRQKQKAGIEPGIRQILIVHLASEGLEPPETCESEADQPMLYACNLQQIQRLVQHSPDAAPVGPPSRFAWRARGAVDYGDSGEGGIGDRRQLTRRPRCHHAARVAVLVTQQLCLKFEIWASLSKGGHSLGRRPIAPPAGRGAGDALSRRGASPAGPLPASGGLRWFFRVGVASAGSEVCPRPTDPLRPPALVTPGFSPRRAMCGTVIPHICVSLTHRTLLHLGEVAHA
jgi:hypothetical protein